MALKDTFKRAASTIFKAFDSLTHTATYNSITDMGFGPPEVISFPIKIILDNFAERDVQFLSFSNLIQPTDVKGLVRGEDLVDISVSTQDTVTIGTETYAIIAHNTDPAKALFTFLMRNV